VRRLITFWRWQVLVVVLAAATLALALVGDENALRSAVVLVFLALSPGLCVLRLVHLRFELPADVAYSVAVSLIIVGTVAGITLYAGAWAPERTATYFAATVIVIALATAVGRDGRPWKLHRDEEP
jgi:uncharacterized membrane protein